MDIVATGCGMSPGWIYGVVRLCVAVVVAKLQQFGRRGLLGPCYDGNRVSAVVIGFGPQKVDFAHRVSRRVPRS